MHEKKVKADSIHYYPRFKKKPTCDRETTKSVWKLLDEADIVVAHNGNRFDLKWINASFLKHGMLPPSPYKTIDTLTQSRGQFYQNTHKLDDLSRRHLGNKKVNTGGFDLWRGIVTGKQ